MRRTRDYHYDLPTEHIAQTPADRREGARLLVAERDRCEEARFADLRFTDVVERIPRDAVLVVNDTRVLPARIHATKAQSGGAVELLALAPAGASRRWQCLARSSKPLRAGALLEVPGGEALRVATDRAEDGTVEIEFPADAGAYLEAHGELPLPPYIERHDGATDADRRRYQTVYARAPGAVAAPTAGLHFTPELLAALEARGVSIAPLTLHVGLGTFAPVRVESIDDHRLHEERYAIPEDTARVVASGRPVVAVGTTVVRALESAAIGERSVAAGPASTDLFITPGYHFRVVDHLITNFHLPGSTLLMLVAAFAGYELVMDAYRHAVATAYRFYSYGDAMFTTRAKS